MDMLQKLAKYFKKTPREQVLRDWEETKEFDNVGITVEDFLKIQKQANDANTGQDKCHIQRVSNNEVSVCDCENYAEWDDGIKWCSVCGRKLS